MFRQEGKEDVESLVTKLRENFFLEAVPGFQGKPLGQRVHHQRWRQRLHDSGKGRQFAAKATAL
jgi:hypothetical protein